MSSGAFVLITNDGNMDTLLLATDLLSDNMAKITQMRYKLGEPDPSPTISDLEKTHLVYFYSSFSPFVSISFEYVRANASGSVTFGGDFLFNIPLYGDLFTDMVIKADFGEVSATNTNERNKYLRYIEFLGERLFKIISFTVNGNKIDDIQSEVYTFYRKFQVINQKEVGWDRMVGQQIAHQAYGDTLSGRGDIQVSCNAYNGLQTPKATHEAFTLFVPLLFWFCEDPRSAIPSVSIPYGQRLITGTINEIRYLLQHAGIDSTWDDPSLAPVPTPTLKMELWINNIYINTDVHDILVKKISFNLCRVHLLQTNDLRNASDKIQLTGFKWPVEHAFICFTPYVNLDAQLPNMITDWHRCHEVVNVDFKDCCSAQIISTEASGIVSDTIIGDITGTQLATPGNIITLNGYDISLAISTNSALYLPNPLTDPITSVWQLYSIFEAAGFGSILNWDLDLFNIPDNLSTTWGTLLSNNFCSKTFKDCNPVVEDITISSHGVNLYNNFDSRFYNEYLPWHYGCTGIRTPEDCGAYMVVWDLFPTQFQPSGYFNFSRARETYIEWKNSIISSANPTRLCALAICLNFLLVADGTAIIRYGT